MTFSSRSKRRFAPKLALLALVPILAACGAAATPPAASTAASVAASAAASTGSSTAASAATSAAASVAASATGSTAATTSDEPASLQVVGFEVSPEEKGKPLEAAYDKFLEDFQTAHPNVTIDSLETPPEFDTQLLVDLAANTGPDLWQQDASTIARLIDSGYVQDMRQCLELEPKLTLDRFFPKLLEIHQRPDGAIYGLPNDFTPMMILYNPEVFKKANVTPPTAGWTWDDLIKVAQETTLDNQGRNRLDPNFDENNVAQWGFRVRKNSFEWIYRVWENGGDVISPDGKTATGYLDSAQTIEAITFIRDLLLKYKVSPAPAAYEQLTQSLGFNDRFLKGEFAMFDRGHWEIFGLTTNAEWQPGRLMVVGQPKKANDETVFYESSWVIRAGLEPAKLKAACQFVEAATDRAYQDTKSITGIAIAANQASAEAAAKTAQYPDIENAFIAQAASGRPPYGAKYAAWPAVETVLDSMMDRILNGGDVNAEVKSAVDEVNRELTKPGAQ